MKKDICGVFNIQECSNLAIPSLAKRIIKYSIKRILLSDTICYDVTFTYIKNILDYWKREKSGRYEMLVHSCHMTLKYDKYQLMRSIIDSEGIKAFDKFLNKHIKEYFGEIYNYEQYKIADNLKIMQDFVRIDKDLEIKSINIDDPISILGVEGIQCLGIEENKEEQKRIIQQLTIKAY